MYHVVLLFAKVLLMQCLNYSKRDCVTSLILLASAGVLFIWTLPGTIALRHIFLITGFIAGLFFLKDYLAIIFCRAAWPLLLFLSFYLWLLIHLLFFSSNFNLQISELLHVWMRCLLGIPLGLALGLLMIGTEASENAHSQLNYWLHISKSDINILVLLIGLSGVAIIGFGRYIFEVLNTNLLFHYDVLFILYKAKQPFVICAALVLPMAFILLLDAINHKRRALWIAISLSIIFLNLFTIYFSNAKNGIIIFIICLILFLYNLLSKLNLNNIILPFLISLLIFCVSYFTISKHIQANGAWNSLITDVKYGLDIDRYDYWKDVSVYSAPIDQSGKKIDQSGYLRAAWFKAGILLLKDNPAGYGLLHHSFGALAIIKYPDFTKPIENLRGATHSGWLDLGLGVGIPGLLLVLIPLFIIWKRSILKPNNLLCAYISWAIPVLVFAYLIDEVGDSHFTEILFFMTAFFCGITLLPKKIKS